MAPRQGHVVAPRSPGFRALTSKERGRPSMSTPLPFDSIDTCWMCGANLDSAWQYGSSARAG